MSETNKDQQSKKIVLVTTEHLIQKRDLSPRGEFRNILLYLVATYFPQLIMEEWRWDGSTTIGHRIADEKLAGAWHCISPPPDLNLKWPNDGSSRGYRNLDCLMLSEYGPIALQTAREQHMVDRIREVTNESQTALLIAGCAHHQSLAEKLARLGYDIESFSWIGPGDGSIPDFVSSDWTWVS